MEIVNLIFNIIVIVLICLVVFFTKNYLPSYMDKKGENLATKEDIEEITRKTEEVQRELKKNSKHFHLTWDSNMTSIISSIRIYIANYTL